jgi:hypothetical protein
VESYLGRKPLAHAQQRPEPMCHKPFRRPQSKMIGLASLMTLLLPSLLLGSPIAALAGTVTFTDDFARATSTDLGNGWLESVGDTHIIANTLRNDASPGDYIATLPNLSGDILWVTAGFSFADVGEGSRLGVILRYQDAGHYYALYRQTGRASGLYIARVVNGVETILTRRLAAPATPGASFRITATADSTKLLLHYTDDGNTTHGATVQGNLTTHDASIPTGSVGVHIRSATSAQHSVNNVGFAAQPLTITLGSPSLAIRYTDLNPNHLTSFLPNGPYYLIDSPITTFHNGATRYWYNSHPQSQAKFTGTLERPYERLIFNKDDLNPAHRFVSDPRGAGGFFWLVNLYRDPAGLLAFIHTELPATPAANYTVAKGRVGLAWSTDNGDTFTYLGHIIIPAHDPQATNIQGIPYFVKDGYFYIYFSEACDAPGNSAVARAPLAEVIAAARTGTLSPWKKYHDGAWNSDGLGGPCSPVKVLDGISHTDAAYSTHTGRYYLLMSRMNWNNEDTWVKLHESSDGINWRHIKTIVQQPASSVISGYQYASIVDAAGLDNGVVGQRFYIYAGKDTQYSYPAASVLRWLVDLSGQPGIFTFARDFTGEQGGNQWAYLSKTGPVYNSMNYKGSPWGSSDKLWSGDEPDLLIARGWVSPGMNADAAIKWTAPQAGTVTISGVVKAFQGSCGDGVIATIFKNNEELWQFTVANNDIVGKDPALSVNVTGGDAIYFTANKRNDNHCDVISWNPTVTYTAVRPDAPMCFINVDKQSAAAGQTVVVAWSSNGAGSAQWSTGQLENIAGAKTIRNLSASQTFSLTVTGVGGQATCSTSVRVVPGPISVPPETARLGSGVEMKRIS